MPETSIDFIYFKEEIDSIYEGDIPLKDKVQAIMEASTSYDAPYPFTWFFNSTSDYKVVLVYSTFVKMIRTARAYNPV